LTNGELLTDSNVRMLMVNRIDAVTISLHSLKEAEQRENAIRSLKKNIPSLTVAFVFHRHNLADLPRVTAWAEEQRIPLIVQPAFIPAAAGDRVNISPRCFTEDQWTHLIPVLRAWGERSGCLRYVDYIVGLYGKKEARPETCAMGTEILVVDYNGTVYPCFHRRDMHAGNLLNEERNTILNRIEEYGKTLCAAPCYGEHCVSLFYGQ
jgi:MoaA/NifB/PqqE/SkfB family radical SAM enzyme